MQIDKLSVSYF